MIPGSRPGTAGGALGAAAGAGWRLADGDHEAAARLSHALGLHPVAARVLAARGITDPDQADAYLHPRLEHLGDPFAMYGMDRAVERILTAAGRGERVLVYGDYDVDGICAAATMWEALRRLGIEAEVYLPHRLKEGYGLHVPPLEDAARRGVSLVITVDTGISATEQARRASQLGLDLIISDHHDLPAELPAALAVLHPRHPQGRYPYPYLSGAGVALRLVDALSVRLDGRAGAGPRLDPAAWLDLAALAAVADVMPLTGHNRVLVALGLQRLRSAPRPGIAALCQVGGADPAALDTREIGFALAPRLNAAGRMGDARLALDLLTTGTSASAATFAQALDTENRARQQVQDEMLRAARDRAVHHPGRVVVLSDPDWHPGVAGIVAAKLCEELGRPVLLACEADGIVHGSARSHPGFDITGALSQCSDLLDAFGGHELAAGFQLPADALPRLRRRLDDLYRRLVGDGAPPQPLHCDAEIRIEDVNDRLARDLARLAPFGEGNPEPVLWLKGVPLAGARPVGRGGSHLKLRLGSPGRVIDGIAFGRGDLAAALTPGGGRYGPAARRSAWDGHAVALDVAARLRRNVWQGRERLELHVVDLQGVSPAARPAAAAPNPPAAVNAAAGAAEAALDHPDRPMLAGLFRLLRRLVVEEAGAVTLERAVDRLSAGTPLSPRAVQRGLTVFREVGLLSVDDQGRVRLRPVTGKVDLEQSPTYRRLAAARNLHRLAGDAAADD